jgi:hypothetical protein
MRVILRMIGVRDKGLFILRMGNGWGILKMGNLMDKEFI